MTKDNYKQWIYLNGELIDLSEKIVKRLQEILYGHIDVLAVNTFLTKGVIYLKSIKLLAEKELWEPAIPIARVLIEHRFTFDYFLKMLELDARKACDRFKDYLMLSMIKQMRSIDFRGLDAINGGPTKDQLLAKEIEIGKKYEEKEFKKLKQFGFAGLSVEEQAKQMNQQAIYNSFYRLFSGSVHPSDLLYFTPSYSFEEKSALDEVYQMWRNVVQYYPHWSVEGIANGANRHFRLGFEENFDILRRKVEILKSQPLQ